MLYQDPPQQEKFESLLAFLGPDREEAGKRYVAVLQKLTAYLTRYASRVDAELLADRTLDKIAENSFDPEVDLTGVDPLRYAFRVARKIGWDALRNSALQRERIQSKFANDRRIALANRDSLADKIELEKLDNALRNLSEEERYLIENYYEGSSKGEISSQRNYLSHQLGLTRPGIRHRAIRIQQKLHDELSSHEEAAKAQFTAYYLPLVSPNQWHSLLAYMHLAEALSLTASDAERRFSLGSSDSRPVKTGTVPPFLKVFVSYSHKDSDIADKLEKAYTAIGFESFRDRRILKSGEDWKKVLHKRIEEAELFQLLWSHAARQSPQVRAEWQHAHSLRRQSFIRPVYWEEPMPEAPPKLKNLQFVYVELRTTV